jgi:glycine reductase complex component B subunit gamma
VVLISAMPQLAQQIGASRVVVGRKIPHPCGDPTLPSDLDKKLRREIVGRALEALLENVSEPKIFVPVSTN